MAQQPATFKRSGTSAILAMVSKKPEPEAARSIPLALKPLLEPYKSHEKLMLRIEQLPQRARLSAGQNNGDQSFSLAQDELDDLLYLLPADIEEPHSLAIRVISRIDGATVAVLSYRIVPTEVAAAAAPPPPGPRPVPTQSVAVDAVALRAELAKARTESEQRLKQAEEEWKARSREMVDAALQKARADWDTEFSGKLKAVAERAEQTLVARRSAWQSELDASIGETEKRTELARAEAREAAKREADTALAAAHERWKTEEAQRLAGAEAKWREQARAAEGEARAKQEKSERDGAELVRLREKLVALDNTAQARERELSAARNTFEQVRADLQRQAESTLALAKADWTREETRRVAESEARLRRESETALAEAGARRERTERALSEAVKQIELLSARRTEAGNAANDEVAALRADLAAAHATLAQAREQAVKDLEAGLSEARARWKGEEEARLAAAEARFRDQSSAVSGEAADLRARADAALASLREKALLAEIEEKKRRDLEAQMRALEASLQARDAEQAQAKEQVRQSAESALADARREWSAGEAARLKDAEARWRTEQEKVFAAAAARADAAERQLAEASAPREVNPRERVEMLKLRDEVEKLRIALEVKDLEVKQARTQFSSPAYSGGDPEASVAPLRRGRMAMRDDPAASEERQRKNRTLVRDIVLIAIVIFLIALAPLSRPWIEPLLPYSLQDEIDQTFGDLYVSQPQAPAKPQAAAPASGAPVLPVETLRRAASLHAGPAKTSTVLATLPTGSRVVRLEIRGNWVHVSVGDTPNGQEGWLYATALDTSGH
jgi:hypothetical protein